MFAQGWCNRLRFDPLNGGTIECRLAKEQRSTAIPSWNGRIGQYQYIFHSAGGSTSAKRRERSDAHHDDRHRGRVELQPRHRRRSLRHGVVSGLPNLRYRNQRRAEPQRFSGHFCYRGGCVTGRDFSDSSPVRVEHHRVERFVGRNLCPEPA